MKPNKPVQATAAAHCSFHAVRGSLVFGFVLAQSPAAVPDLSRCAFQGAKPLSDFWRGRSNVAKCVS